jgi:PAS domain S-box-containing protein
VQQSERRLSVVFSQVAVGMMETNLEGEILLANQRLCDLLDRPRERVLGCRLHDLAHPDDLEMIRAVFDGIRAGEPSVVTEMRCVRGDASYAWLNITVSVVTATDGKPSFTVAVVQDVTARKRAEDELRAAVRARDDFLSIASHELKTPITSLQPQLERVTRAVSAGNVEASPSDKLAWRLGIMTRQVERLKALVDNLLDVTTITSGRLRISPKETDLRELALQVVASYKDVIRRVGSEISITAERPVIGLWDPLALERVLTNLLSNAAKFGGGRPIEVTVDQADGVARMVVQDHGIGIAPEQTQRIFQRFEQAVPPEHYGGLGLGLWIARQVVDAHGGTIQVASSAEGATFTVQLPLAGAGTSIDKGET